MFARERYPSNSSSDQGDFKCDVAVMLTCWGFAPDDGLLGSRFLFAHALLTRRDHSGGRRRVSSVSQCSGADDGNRRALESWRHLGRVGAFA